MRYEGRKDVEISGKLGYHRQRVSQLCAEIKRFGLKEYSRLKCDGNHRALTDEAERDIIDSFKEKASKGKDVTVQDIKAAFDKKRSKDTGRGYIYMLLKRHGWRKIMPRSKHPNKACDEAIKT